LYYHIKPMNQNCGAIMSQSGSDVNIKKYKPSSVRILDQVREVLRYHHYGLRTEESYVRWIKQYINMRLNLNYCVTIT